MILRLTHGMSALGLRIRETVYEHQVISWENLELVILPGQIDADCGPNGSPWILTGCWPGKRTGVDIANPRRDFPPMIFHAYKLDKEGRVVFHLDERMNTLPPGRYTGILRAAPRPAPPAERARLLVVAKPKKDRVIPAEYWQGYKECDPGFPSDPPPPPPPQVCELARFDIDLCPMCVDHMIDQVSVDFPPADCGVSDGAT